MPRGRTALLDAVSRSIAETGERLAAMPAEQRPNQVLFVIVTDGGENASQEHTLFNGGRESIFRMITHQREKYSWEFVFLGANQDSIATATSLGISPSNAVKFGADVRGTKALMGGLSASVSTYRSTGRAREARLYDQKAYEVALKDADPKPAA